MACGDAANTNITAKMFCYGFKFLRTRNADRTKKKSVFSFNRWQQNKNVWGKSLHKPKEPTKGKNPKPKERLN